MTFLLFLALLIYTLRLNDRIRQLEEKIKSPEREHGQAPVQPSSQSAPHAQDASEQPLAVAAIPPAKESPLSAKSAENIHFEESVQGAAVNEVPVEKPQEVVKTGPTAFDKFVEWVKEDFLVKLGGFLLLIAFGWFVSYAVANDWISETGRILLGFFSGVAIVALGEWRIKKYLHQGGIFLVLGSGIILLTTFAGRELYDLFTPLIALIVIFLSAAYVSFVALRYDNQHLGVAGVVLAMIAPLFVASPEPSLVGLFSYLVVAVLGALWIVYQTGWRLLGAMSLFFVLAYSIPYFIGEVAEADRISALVFANIFALIFFASNLRSMFVELTQLGRAHIWTAVGTGLYIVTWILTTAEDFEKSFLLLLWMILFGGAAYLAVHNSEKKQPFYIYLMVSLVCLAAATANELTGGALVVAYTIEVTAMVFGIYSVLKDSGMALRVAFLFAGPVILSFNTIVNYTESNVIFHKDFTTLLVLLLSFLGLGLYLKASHIRNKEDKTLDVLASAILLGFIVYLGVLTGLELSGGVLMVVYAFEVMILMFSGYFLYQDSRVVTFLSVLYTIPAILSLNVIANYTNETEILHADFSSLFMLLVISTMIAFVFRSKAHEKDDLMLRQISNLFFSVSIAYLLVITALELSGPALLVVLSLETVLLVIMARFMFGTFVAVRNMSLLFIAPVIVSSASLISSSWNDGVIHGDFFALLTLTVSLLGVGSFLHATSKEDDDPNLVFTLAGAGVLYILFLIWLVFHALFENDIGTMISLIVYTILGLIAFVKGRISDNTLLKYGGGTLIGFVVGRLLLIEVWDMELTGRIITFFVIGVLLVMTAFIGRKKNNVEKEMP